MKHLSPSFEQAVKEKAWNGKDYYDHPSKSDIRAH